MKLLTFPNKVGLELYSSDSAHAVSFWNANLVSPDLSFTRDVYLGWFAQMHVIFRLMKRQIYQYSYEF